MTDPRPSTILFIGDITGQPALEYLEQYLPAWLTAHPTDFVIANAENLEISGNGAGMTRASLERLFATGVQLVTGGNHSWDGSEGATVHTDPRVLRPINVSPAHPGRGAGIVTSSRGQRLGVVNVAGRSAIPGVTNPLSAIGRQLEGWDVDAALIDFHGESVFEKTSIAQSKKTIIPLRREGLSSKFALLYHVGEFAVFSLFLILSIKNRARTFFPRSYLAAS